MGNRSKTDKIDAKILYRFQNLVNPDEIKVPKIEKEAEELSMYLSSYEFLLKMRVSISNHIEAMEYNVNVPEELFSALK